ncbi:hypothetical protein MAR_025528, partial [Mya arenaria]
TIDLDPTSRCHVSHGHLKIPHMARTASTPCAEPKPSQEANFPPPPTPDKTIRSTRPQKAVPKCPQKTIANKPQKAIQQCPREAIPQRLQDTIPHCPQKAIPNRPQKAIQKSPQEAIPLEAPDVLSMKNSSSTSRGTKTVDVSKRFVNLSENPTEYVMMNENKLTRKQTNSHIQLLKSFLLSKNELREIEAIPYTELDEHLKCKKTDGDDYEPVMLRSMISSIDRILSKKQQMSISHTVAATGFSPQASPVRQIQSSTATATITSSQVIESLSEVKQTRLAPSLFHGAVISGGVFNISVNINKNPSKNQSSELTESDEELLHIK